jgi:hypothetical protein
MRVAASNRAAEAVAALGRDLQGADTLPPATVALFVLHISLPPSPSSSPSSSSGGAEAQSQAEAEAHAQAEAEAEAGVAKELQPLSSLLSSLGRPSLLVVGAQRCCLASSQLARQKQVLERSFSSSSSSSSSSGGGQGGGSLLASRWDEGREQQLKQAVKQANLAAVGFAVFSRASAPAPAAPAPVPASPSPAPAAEHPSV